MVQSAVWVQVQADAAGAGEHDRTTKERSASWTGFRHAVAAPSIQANIANIAILQTGTHTRPERTAAMLPAIEVGGATSRSSATAKSQAVNGHDPLKAQGSAPMMQTTASSAGNIHLYDNFLSKLEGSPNWPAEKEAVRCDGSATCMSAR